MKFATPLLLLASMLGSANAAIEMMAWADATGTTDTSAYDAGNAATQTIEVPFSTDGEAVPSVFKVTPAIFQSDCTTAFTLATASSTVTYTTNQPFYTAKVTLTNSAEWPVGANTFCLKMQLILVGDIPANDQVFSTVDYAYTITVAVGGDASGTVFYADTGSNEAAIAASSGTAAESATAANDEVPTITATVPTGTYAYGSEITVNIAYAASAAGVFTNYAVTEIQPYAAGGGGGRINGVTAFRTSPAAPSYVHTGGVSTAQNQAGVISDVYVPLSIYQAKPTAVGIGFKITYAAARRRLDSAGSIRGLVESGEESSTAEANIKPLTKEDLEGVSDAEMREAGIDPADYFGEAADSAGVMAQVSVALVALLGAALLI